MLKKWQFIKKPVEKWPHRFEVKIASDSKDDIILLLEKYDGAYGTIISLKGGDFNYSFYLYDGSEEEIKKLDNIFKGIKDIPLPPSPPSSPPPPLPIESEKVDRGRLIGDPPKRRESEVLIERFSTSNAPQQLDKPSLSKEEKEKQSKLVTIDESNGVDEIKKVTEEKDGTAEDIKDTINSVPSISAESPVKKEEKKIKKKRKISRIIKLGVVYHKEDEMVKIKADKSSESKEIKMDQFVFEKMKEVVEDRNINIDFKEGLKLAYRNEKDFADLNKLIFQDKTDALIVITRKGNNSKVEELFKHLGVKVYYINKKFIEKQYKYLNFVTDMALDVK